MMIEAGGGTVTILYADGTSASFDPEELRQRLEKSFIAAGRTEAWIAGEIVLAVEYALRCRFSGEETAEPVIQAAEIDECVVRILEDSGYPDITGPFQRHAATSGDFGKLSPDGVEQYLAEKLHLTGPAGRGLADRIRNAMNAIGAEQCSPRLVLELARHFRENAASSCRLPVPRTGHSEGTVTSGGGKNILHVRRLDAIFPSIRAEIDLARLFASCRLEPPLTELSLSPILLPVAEQLDAECSRLRGGGAENHPLVLTLHGFSDFAVRWLCYDSAETGEMRKKHERAFSIFFHSLMREKPFKTFFR